MGVATVPVVAKLNWAIAESRMTGFSYEIRHVFIVTQCALSHSWVNLQWKTCRIPYENAYRTGFRNLSNNFHTWRYDDRHGIGWQYNYCLLCWEWLRLLCYRLFEVVLGHNKAGLFRTSGCFHMERKYKYKFGPKKLFCHQFLWLMLVTL